MRIELLWTDKCLFVVLFLCFIFIIRSLRREPTRRAFKRIFEKPFAVNSFIILLFFLLIGICDSIHFTKSSDEPPDSVLDHILSPLGSVFEKTYSAPFSLTLYASVTSFTDGKAIQVVPRLEYPPAKIKNDQDASESIKDALLKGVLFSFTIVLLLGAAIIALRRVFFNKHTHLFNSVFVNGLLTLFICLACVFVAYRLSRSFHIMGTGKIGQDIFYYTIKSIRTGLVIGTLTTLFMMPLALLLGIAAGYYGGFVDDVIQYVYTTLSSIPGVLLITASVLSMQTYITNHPEQFTTLAQNADARLLALCLILGVTSWTSLCRLLRAEALKLREMEYVAAAKALGTRSYNIIFKHLLPNVMHIVIITLVLDFSFLVLAEAVLSYVGVGVSPLTISWGNMINAARLELAREPIVWWPVISAFIMMFTLVLSSNLFADAVRDAFDPRQK